jgi:large subunit ribosomal protein L29
MAVGSPELVLEELDAMTSENLLNELAKAKTEMFNLRFQHATGQLETHGRILAVRKDIARIQTFLRERQLGIRTEPGALESVNDSQADSLVAQTKVKTTVNTKPESGTKSQTKSRTKSQTKPGTKYPVDSSTVATKTKSKTATKGRPKSTQSSDTDSAETKPKSASILQRLKSTVRKSPVKESSKIAATKGAPAQSKTKFTRQKKG